MSRVTAEAVTEFLTEYAEEHPEIDWFETNIKCDLRDAYIQSAGVALKTSDKAIVNKTALAFTNMKRKEADEKSKSDTSEYSEDKDKESDAGVIKSPFIAPCPAINEESEYEDISALVKRINRTKQAINDLQTELNQDKVELVKRIDALTKLVDGI